MAKKENRYVDFGDYLKIELYKPKSLDVIDYVLISCMDYPKAQQIFWRKSEYGYARGYDRVSKRDVLLHVYLLGGKGLIDHINRDKLDCRRENLRRANKQINAFNIDTPGNSKTGVKGVSFDKRKQKYRAYIKINQRQIFLGYYDSLIEAGKARLLYEQELFKKLCI